MKTAKTAKTAKIVRPLDPDTYDTLELGALAFGGIGRGAFVYITRDSGTTEETLTPCCALGIVAVVEGEGGYFSSPGSQALYAIGVDIFENDAAVARINERRRRAPCARVSFAEWCEELGVVRDTPSGD